MPSIHISIEIRSIFILKVIYVTTITNNRGALVNALMRMGGP